jgi:hypothetical protein
MRTVCSKNNLEVSPRWKFAMQRVPLQKMVDMLVDQPAESPVRVVVVKNGWPGCATSEAAVRTTTRRADSNDLLRVDRRID